MPYLAFYNVERNRQGTVQETTRSDVHTRAQRENHRTVPRSDRTTLKHEGGTRPKKNSGRLFLGINLVHGLKRAEALGVSWRADWDHG